MMKVNFLKRLESSVKSFEITMGRTIAKIEALETKIRAYLSGVSGSQDANELELDLGVFDEDEDLEESILVGGKFKYRLGHLELDRGRNWLKDLKKDKDQLSILLMPLKRSRQRRTLSLPTSRNSLPPRLPTRRSISSAKKTKKFSSSLPLQIPQPTSTIPLSGGPKKTSASILRSFAVAATRVPLLAKPLSTRFLRISLRVPNIATKSRQCPRDGEIDLIIATDCISEGQNLQDCDYLVNYDIHWNPVRIIQRFGRIDRIGSVSHSVQLVNFWPTEDLNKYINLKNRVEARMALVDIAATFEDNILQN